jgi:hypothetical protein
MRFFYASEEASNRARDKLVRVTEERDRALAELAAARAPEEDDNRGEDAGTATGEKETDPSALPVEDAGKDV